MFHGIDATEAAALGELVGLAGGNFVRMTYARAQWQHTVAVFTEGSATAGVTARRCELASVPVSLGALANLERLELSGNQLRHVPETLGSLRRLRELYLHENWLEELPETFAGLSELRVLDLATNSLRKLPDLSRLAHLEFLYVTKNRLVELPAMPASLRYLNAGENPHVTIDSIAALPNLVELRLCGNAIANLPGTVSWPRLRELHLRDNGLSELPPSLYAHAKLEVLDLRDNVLDELPAAIGEMQELQHLDLRSNMLDTLPTALLELPHLRKLDLRWNRLRTRPDWLPRLAERGCIVYG